MNLKLDFLAQMMGFLVSNNSMIKKSFSFFTATVYLFFAYRFSQQMDIGAVKYLGCCIFSVFAICALCQLESSFRIMAAILAFVTLLLFSLIFDPFQESNSSQNQKILQFVLALIVSLAYLYTLKHISNNCDES
jgi:hypothetical protein